MSTKLGTLTLDLVARIGSFTQGMKQASTTAEREMRRVENSVVTVDGLIKKLAVTAGSVFSISQIVGYADGYTGLKNKLKLVTNGQGELNKAMQDAFAVAQRSNASWESTATIYQRFAQNSERLGLSQERVARITETVSKAVAISGASTEGANAAMMQFGQSLASGVLRGEEFNSVNEQTPAVLDAIAKGLGVARADLKKMADAGKLTTDVLIPALEKAGVSVDKLFGKTDMTIGQSITFLNNEVLKFVGGAGEASGAASLTANSIKLLGENLDLAANAAGVMAAVYAGRVVSGYAASIIASSQQQAALTAEQAANVQLLGIQAQRARQNVALALTEVNLARAAYNDATTSVARAAANQRLITTNIALGLAEKQATITTAAYTYASTVAAGATTRLAAAKIMLARVGTSLLGALGGPVGLAVMLGTVAAGYLLTKDSTDESTKSLRENNESVADAIKKYRELDEVKRRYQLVSEKEKLNELADAYDKSSTKLITATYSLSRHNDMTTEQSKQVNALIAEYKQTGNIETFSNKINTLTFVSQNSKDGFNKLAAGVKDAGDQAKTQKTLFDQISGSVKNTGDQAKKSAVEVSKLSEDIKKLLSTNAEDTGKNNFISTLVNQNFDQKLVELVYEYRKAEGILGTTKRLSSESLKSVSVLWESQQKLNAASERQKNIEEAKKKAIEAQGNAMKVNALVASNAAKYNFAGIEQKNNLPSGLLSALHMQESKGNIKAYNSSSGATGGFQFLKATGDQYGVKNRNDLAQSAEGAGKYMAYLLKLFKGDLNKAISAYHAGEGNVQKGTNIGPINRQYVKNINGYMGGSSGASFTEDYSYDDYIKETEQHLVERERRESEQAEKRKHIEIGVATEVIRIRSKLADDVKGINEAGFTPEKTTEMIAEYQKRAAIDIQVSEASHTDKISGYSDYLKSEEQLLNESFARRQRDLKFDLTLTTDEYKAASSLLENERDKELQKAKWRALEIRQAMVDQIKGLSVGADDIFAKAAMSPSHYKKWSIDNDRSDAQVGLKKERVKAEQEIVTSDSYSTDDERYQALLDVHQEYRDGMAAIDVDYSERVKDLEQSQYNNQLNIYGSLLSQASGVWGSMTDMVKNSAGESSAAYKAMFLAQQAIAIGQAIINTEVGATAALKTDPTGFMSVMTRGLGYASVGMIAAQTITGMAHNGIDNIPKEGTWLLDGGERVLNPQQNKDLTNYLSNQSSGGDVHISVQVTDSGVSAQSNQADQKQLGQMIGNAVRAVIMQEKRQGGLLSR